MNILLFSLLLVGAFGCGLVVAYVAWWLYRKVKEGAEEQEA